MKRNVYAYYDTVTESYRDPFLQDAAPEIVATSVTRALKYAYETNNLSNCKGLQTCKLYHIGTFDDESCVYDVNPILIVDCVGICSSYSQNNSYEEKSVS